jgi:di/tricarboxylate transporter
MATALDRTGGMQLIVRGLEPLGAGGPARHARAPVLLTSVLSQVISNTATAVLIAPVAVGAAAELAVSPYPFMMAVAVAASTAFATPIASPVTMLVLGPGEYRFGDFVRTGLLLQSVIFLVTLALVPLLFPF